MFQWNFADFFKEIRFGRSPQPPNQAMNSALEFHFPGFGILVTSVTGTKFCFLTLFSKGVLPSLIFSVQARPLTEICIKLPHQPAPKATLLSERQLHFS